MQKLNTNKLLNFGSFLNEATENKEVSLLILSGEDSLSKTAKSFVDECKKKKIICNVVNVDNISLESLYNGHLITIHDSTKEIMIDPTSTVIVPRRGVVKNSKTKQILRVLEAGRYFCVNSLDSIEIAENKYLTSVLLEDAGLPIPRYAVVTDESTLDPGLEKIGGNFPVIIG